MRRITVFGPQGQAPWVMVATEFEITVEDGALGVRWADGDKNGEVCFSDGHWNSFIECPDGKVQR